MLTDPPAPPSFGTPAAEVHIDVYLVRALLQSQYPELATLPLQPVDSGFDNMMFRLGDDLAVRLPRRTVAADLAQNEQHWLPMLAPRLPLPIPVPVHIGAPADGYPWPWSIVRWIPGIAADLSPPARGEAIRLAGFLDALHVEAPEGAPHNVYRGVPLASRAEAFGIRIHRLKELATTIDPAVMRAWELALATSIDVAPTWIHGDLHARNVMVEDGNITGIIDWGDMAAGDRATDLASIWMLFEDPADRLAAMRACGSVSDATWVRARGWAVLFGVLLLATGLVDHPRHAAIGANTLRRLVAGP